MSNPGGQEKVSPHESTSSSKGKSLLMLEGSAGGIGVGGSAKSALNTPSRMKYTNGKGGGPILGSTTIDIHGGHMSDQASYHCSASSVESLPSASGSSKRAILQ